MYQHNSHERCPETERGVQCIVTVGQWCSEWLDLVDLVCDCLVWMGPVDK